MNRILFISGMIPRDNEIDENSINFMNNAANAFQSQFIEGIRQNNCEPIVVSAPFIGPYPKSYKKIFYKAKSYEDGYKYVSFFNLWGVRNFSRVKSLKKELKKTEYQNIDKVIVYSVHTPFAKVAKYMKKKNKHIQICLIVPDLPEYMNLRKKKSIIYKVAKYLDCKAFYNSVKYFDSFSFVSSHQAEKVNLYDKNQVVVEAISENVAEQYTPLNSEIKKIVYTGSLNKQFGVLDLVDAVCKMDNNVELHICGNGDAVEELKMAASSSSKIKFLGEVSREEARKLQMNADVLVNPRINEGEYTKYSFPSKTMEYLSTGRPVVCHKLDGIPQEYDSHLIYVEEKTVDSLKAAIEIALSYDENKLKEIFISNTNFLKENKNMRESAKKILSMFD